MTFIRTSFLLSFEENRNFRIPWKFNWARFVMSKRLQHTPLLCIRLQHYEPNCYTNAEHRESSLRRNRWETADADLTVKGKENWKNDVKLDRQTAGQALRSPRPPRVTDPCSPARFRFTSQSRTQTNPLKRRKRAWRGPAARRACWLAWGARPPPTGTRCVSGEFRPCRCSDSTF